MLYYNEIAHSEGIDKSEGQDSIGITNLTSRQCYDCLCCFYITENFKYEIHLCDHCHRCVLREKTSKSAIFRTINTKEDYLNEETGVLYKGLNEFEQKKRVEI